MPSTDSAAVVAGGPVKRVVKQPLVAVSILLAWTMPFWVFLLVLVLRSATAAC